MTDEAQPALIGGPPPPHPFVGDLGGVFATDAHRRVLGHLPLPTEDTTTVELLTDRLADDGGLARALNADEITRVLTELEADAHASSQNGWRMTDTGLEAIRG